MEPKHWAILAGILTGVATQLLTVQHGWQDIATPGFVAGLMIQIASAITAIFVGAPGASAALAKANANTDMANASTRAALADPPDLGKGDPKRFIGPAVLIALIGSGALASGCASMGRINIAAEHATSAAIAQTVKLHDNRTLSDPQFRAANAVLYRVALAGLTFTRIQKSGAATPVDVATFLGVVTQAVHDLTIIAPPLADPLRSLQGKLQGAIR